MIEIRGDKKVLITTYKRRRPGLDIKIGDIVWRGRRS